MTGLAVLLAACDGGPLRGPDVAALVAGEEVRYGQFEQYLRNTVGESGMVLASDVLSALFDQFLDERLLARLAAEEGVAAPGEGPRAAVESLLEAELGDGPDGAAVAAYYRARREDFRRQERVRVRQILVKERPVAERALAEIRAGADFADVARRFSRDPAAGSGGDQAIVGGMFERDDLPADFADVLFRLEPGEVSEIIAADYGFLLFQVVERAPGEIVPLAQVRGEVAAALRRQQADAALARLVREARSRYDVRVDERNLPFHYQGAYATTAAAP